LADAFLISQTSDVSSDTSTIVFYLKTQELTDLRIVEYCPAVNRFVSFFSKIFMNFN